MRLGSADDLRAILQQIRTGASASTSASTTPTCTNTAEGAPARATPPPWRGSSTGMLGGTSRGTLLNAYGTERAPNLEAVIELTIELGKMI